MLGKSGILIHSLLKQHRIGLYGLNDVGSLFEHAFPSLAVSLCLSLSLTHNCVNGFGYHK